MTLSKQHQRAAEYRGAIAALGMTQQSAGRFLGLSPSTAGRYARGETPILDAVMLLLRTMIREGLTPADVKPE